MPNLNQIKEVIAEVLAEPVDGLEAMNQALRDHDPFRLDPPAVDGLVVNPHYTPVYLLGQIPIDGNLMQPFENFWNNMEYLRTSTSDTMYCQRLQEISEEFFKNNLLAESGGHVGYFAAGVIATKNADRYLQDAIMEVSKAKIDGFNQLSVMGTFKRNRSYKFNSYRG